MMLVYLLVGLLAAAGGRLVEAPSVAIVDGELEAGDVVIAAGAVGSVTVSGWVDADAIADLQLFVEGLLLFGTKAEVILAGSESCAIEAPSQSLQASCVVCWTAIVDSVAP